MRTPVVDGNTLSFDCEASREYCMRKRRRIRRCIDASISGTMCKKPSYQTALMEEGTKQVTPQIAEYGRNHVETKADVRTGSYKAVRFFPLDRYYMS